jgi:hypothetical protein
MADMMTSPCLARRAFFTIDHVSRNLREVLDNLVLVCGRRGRAMKTVLLLTRELQF